MTSERAVPWVCAGAGVVVVALSTVAQLWWVPVVVGAVTGAVTGLRRGPVWVAVAATLLAVLVGWAVPLLVQASSAQPLLGTAAAAGALAGLPASGWLVLAATAFVALLEGVTGVWCGRAAMALRRASKHSA